MEEHSLIFATHRGSLKIEIEHDLDVFKDIHLNSSDHYFYTRLKEISDELLLLREQKKYNDIIWKVIKFKTQIGSYIHLYKREDDSYFTSLIHPDEWKNPEYFNYQGSYILTTKNIWEEIK